MQLYPKTLDKETGFQEIKRVVKSYFCLIAFIFLTSCVFIPVPVEREVLDGKQFTDSDLDLVRLGTTTRPEVIDNWGEPTIWLSDQRIMVYGLRQVETGAFWLLHGGYGVAYGLTKGETKKAVFLVLDDDDVVKHWGRAKVKHGETWLSAATKWAGSKAIEIPRARSRFVEEAPTTEQSLIYFYRARDYQHFLPLVPPAKQVMLGIAKYADILQDDKLMGQIRWQSYVAVRVQPGAHSFVVNADTDYVVNPEIYRSATIQLDVAPETVTFVDVGIQAGLGTVEPILVERPRSDAITVIEELRESW